MTGAEAFAEAFITACRDSTLYTLKEPMAECFFSAICSISRKFISMDNLLVCWMNRGFGGALAIRIAPFLLGNGKGLLQKAGGLVLII